MSRKNNLTLDLGQRLLMECALFRPLVEEVRYELASRALRSRFAAGEVIFHIGTEGRSMMAVLAGTVRISIPSPQGKEVVLVDLGPGEIFGEIALLDGDTRSADAAALTNCELVVLNRRDVLPILREHPDVALKLLEVVCRRLRDADERMTDILFFDAPVRLAKILLRNAGVARDNVPSAAGIKVGLSQRELGNMAGVRRERINRCLQEWVRRDIIRVRDGWIVIQRPDLLEEVARSG